MRQRFYENVGCSHSKDRNTEEKNGTECNHNTKVFSWVIFWRRCQITIRNVSELKSFSLTRNLSVTSGRVTCRAGVDGALAARAIAEARREQREPHRSPPKGGVAGQITSAHEWRRPRCPGGWFTLLTDLQVTHHEKNQPSNRGWGGFRVTSSRLSRMFGEPIGRVSARFHASATLPHTHSRHARTPPRFRIRNALKGKRIFGSLPLSV